MKANTRAQLAAAARLAKTCKASRPALASAVPNLILWAQPSLVEPLGQALLEAMACGRSVVATRIGGPSEFVPPEAGVLVDPLDVTALSRALAQAAALPSPNLAAREATAEHDVRRQAERIEAILSRAAARDQRA